MNDLLTGTYGIVIKIALVVALCGGLYGTYKFRVHQAVQEAVQVVNVQHSAELFSQKEKLLDKAREKEQELQANFNKTKEENDAKIKSLNTSVASLLDSLRNRPTREASNSSTTQSTDTTASPEGSTGAGLYRDDASVLVRFASDTETLKLGLIQCYREYDDVKKAVESFSKK